MITLGILFFGSAIALITSQGNMNYNNFSPLIICMFVSFVIHWIIFIPSYLYKTEKFFDITGTLGYIFVLAVSSYLSIQLSGEALGLRSLTVISFILIWALRLGIFLFSRVIRIGEDARFNDVKKVFSKFLIWWTLSALWVFLTSINALTMILDNPKLSNDIFFHLGCSLWIFGFLFEVISDHQKKKFNSNPTNKDKFITSGLWSISRHPNYFGEIILWVGISIITFPTLDGWQYLSLISPIFVALLLIKVSGINILEQRSQEKWGKLESYKQYKENTPVLFPFLNK